MATTTALTSELEAVNIVLQAAGEAPVASLSLTGLLPLANARAVLDETSRLVQSAGWAFNTEDDYTLYRNGDGEIPVPPSALKFDANDDYRPACDPVVRGTKLYDKAAHTSVFTQDIKGTLVSLLEWNDLPQPIRHYIAIKAARSFQGRDLGSDSINRFTERDEAEALLACGQYEADVGDANMLTDNYDNSVILAGRYY